MSIKLAVPAETIKGERRIAIDPVTADKLEKLGVEVLIQSGAGKHAYIPDTNFKNAKIIKDLGELLAQADLVFKVQPPEAEEIDKLKEGAVIVGFMSAHSHLDRVTKMRDRKITSFAMELIPRISRAQSMDALSSQASIAGYKAAIMGSDLSNRFFPMLTTAAGTIRPSKVLVIGAGVAGLQAIATAKRLGAQIEAYDVRAATKEQIQSLGAKFIEMDVKAEGEGGYARELTEEEKQKQQDVLAKHISMSNVVISTAAIPGRPSPKIISRAMVEGMQPGSVIIDIAAEGGGNCELTQPGKTIEHKGVIIHAPLNVPSQVPFHASEMYSKNLFNFIQPMIKDGVLVLDWQDEIIAKSVVTHAGEIKHEPTLKLVEGEKS